MYGKNYVPPKAVDLFEYQSIDPSIDLDLGPINLFQDNLVPNTRFMRTATAYPTSDILIDGLVPDEDNLDKNHPSLPTTSPTYDILTDDLEQDFSVLPTAPPTSDILPASPTYDISTDDLLQDHYVLPNSSPTSDILPDDISDGENNVSEELTEEEEKERQVNHNHQQFSTVTQESLQNDDVGLEELSKSERLKMGDSNIHIRKLIVDNGLHLICNNQIQSAYSRGRERGLFHLFLYSCFLDNMRIWTNEKLNFKHKPAMTNELFMAYLGIEITSSPNPMHKLSHYWSRRAFVGSGDISSVMSR